MVQIAVEKMIGESRAGMNLGVMELGNKKNKFLGAFYLDESTVRSISYSICSQMLGENHPATQMTIDRRLGQRNGLYRINETQKFKNKKNTQMIRMKLMRCMVCEMPSVMTTKRGEIEAAFCTEHMPKEKGQNLHMQIAVSIRNYF